MNFVRLAGISGAQYDHSAFDPNTPWLEWGANYAFAYYAAIVNTWGILYVGETENMKSRLRNHEVWREAELRGATHVLVHFNSNGVDARRAVERDLIALYNPPLNIQHRVQNPFAGSLAEALGFGLDPLKRNGIG